MSEKSKSHIPIRFVIEGIGKAEGELIRHLAPRTVQAIVDKLPVEGVAALWKEEAYFEIPVKMGSEKAKSTVEKGTVGFWPMGNAICIFYGDTQPYSPVNVIGKITKNLELFRKVKNITKIRVERT